MRDVRCVLAHPTLMNCFIESYGLNFVPEDLKRDTVLQQVTADVGSQGGAMKRGLLTQSDESEEKS